MIVCSCNVLSEKQILETLQREDVAQSRSPAKAYRCLGCAPQCGRCLRTVRQLLADARVHDCEVGCAICPGHETAHHQDEAEVPMLIAAE